MRDYKWLAGLVLLATGCSVDDRPATWDYISPMIMEPNCATASCHGRAAAVAGLDFSDPQRGYTSLMKLKVWVVDPTGTAGCRTINGNVVCQRDFRPLVTPYNTEQSRLVNMLRARGADRMPPDRPLTGADIDLIARWIRDGATWGKPHPDAGSRDIGITTSVTLPDGTMIITASDGTRTVLDPQGHVLPPDGGAASDGGAGASDAAAVDAGGGG